MYQSQGGPGTHLNNTYPEPQEVWGLQEIANFLRTSKGAARRLVNEPKFPGPIANQCRNRRWFADEVKVYLRARAKGEVALTSKITANTNYIPKSIRSRPLNVVNS
jgi:hypothetical protein